MLPDIPAGDDLFVATEAAPLSSPPSSARRDSGIGEVGIDSLDNILGPVEAELPRLEVEDDDGYTLPLQNERLRYEIWPFQVCEKT